MTRTLSLRSLDIPSVHKFGIGFDNILNELLRINEQQSNTNYPPYNIIKESDNDFSIEIAVAGFREGDISISVEKNILTVKGQQLETVDEEGKTVEYLHRGISARDFVRTFTLADHVEVVGAVNQLGILSINLKRIVPLEELPKQIDIKYLT